MKTLPVILLLAWVIFSLHSSAQIPVKMSQQPALSFTENFDDIRNWTDHFTSGEGAACWSPVTVNAAGTIPDGITTTVSTETFSTGLTKGIQKSPKDADATYMAFVTSGITDNTTALAADLHLDFSGVNAGFLQYADSIIYTGTATSDHVATLQVYSSTDGYTFTPLSGTQYIAVNHASGKEIIHVKLPAAFNNAPQAVLRFYCYNGTGGSVGNRPKVTLDSLLITAADIPLPVILRSFTVETEKTQVWLKWTTAMEQHTDHFEVERSYNGRQFIAVGKVAARGNTGLPSSYQYRDIPLLTGQLFYRLKMVDKDGHFSHSPVVKPAATSGIPAWLYPNPVQTSLILRLYGLVQGTAQIQIVNSAGQTYRLLRVNAGEEQLNIPVGDLLPGRYWIKITSAKGITVLSFLKQ